MYPASPYIISYDNPRTNVDLGMAPFSERLPSQPLRGLVLLIRISAYYHVLHVQRERMQVADFFLARFVNTVPQFSPVVIFRKYHFVRKVLL